MPVLKKNILFKLIILILITIVFSYLLNSSCSSINSYDGDGIKAEIWLDKIKSEDIKNNIILGLLHLKIINQTDENIFIEYSTIGNPKIFRYNILQTQDLSYNILHSVSNQEIPPEIRDSFACYSRWESKKDSSNIPIELISKMEGIDFITLGTLDESQVTYGLDRKHILDELEVYFQDRIILNKQEVFETCYWLRLSSFHKGNYKIFVKYPNERTSKSLKLINNLNHKLELNLDKYNPNIKRWDGKFVSNIIEIEIE